MKTYDDLYIDVMLGNGHTSSDGTHSRNIGIRATGRLTATAPGGVDIDRFRKEAHRQLDELLKDLICRREDQQ